MIYEDGKDPRYDLPVGVSMRHFRGLDVVYLNCAACHTGIVRDEDEVRDARNSCFIAAYACRASSSLTKKRVWTIQSQMPHVMADGVRAHVPG